jgi:7-cyano-7-deazaguanine synthase
MTMHSAVCLTSGGQDSTTCLYWAMRRFDRLLAVAFDYGQRHRIELQAAQRICEQARVPLKILKLSILEQLGGTALIGSTDLIRSDSGHNGLPNSFVPGRNLLFLTIAAAYAYQHEINDLVIGTCQTDYSGYPDCRESTIQAMAHTLSLGLDHPVYIHTPLMYLTKGQTVHLAEEVGAIEALASSHTCYEGLYPPCGDCLACELRAKGFKEAGLMDPLLQRVAQTKESP